MTTSEDYRFGMAPGPYSGNYGAPCLPSLGEPCGNCHRCCRCGEHPVPAPQTALGAPQSPNPTTTTPGDQTGAQGRHPYEPPTEDA